MPIEGAIHLRSHSIPLTWWVSCRTPPLQFPDTRSSIEIRYGDFFRVSENCILFWWTWCLLPPLLAGTEYRLHNVYGVSKPWSYYPLSTHLCFIFVFHLLFPFSSSLLHAIVTLLLYCLAHLLTSNHTIGLIFVMYRVKSESFISQLLPSIKTSQISCACWTLWWLFWHIVLVQSVQGWQSISVFQLSANSTTSATCTHPPPHGCRINIIHKIKDT